MGHDVYTKSKQEAPQWSLQTIRGQAQAFKLTQCAVIDKKSKFSLPSVVLLDLSLLVLGDVVFLVLQLVPLSLEIRVRRLEFLILLLHHLDLLIQLVPDLLQLRFLGSCKTQRVLHPVTVSGCVLSLSSPAKI